jgi:hypothetical protein
MAGLVGNIALAEAAPVSVRIQQHAFGSIKPCRTGSGTAVKFAPVSAREVRGSNPLSSTTHSPETDISACDAETQVISAT